HKKCQQRISQLTLELTHSQEGARLFCAMSRKRRPLTSNRNKTPLKDRACYQMTLTRAHVQVLETEANLWGVGRGDFLTMLLRRKHGELVFERPKKAPSYTFSEKELLEPERYAWYLPKQDIPKLASDCLKLGNIAPATWVVLTLNEWIG